MGGEKPQSSGEMPTILTGMAGTDFGGCNAGESQSDLSIDEPVVAEIFSLANENGRAWKRKNIDAAGARGVKVTNEGESPVGFNVGLFHSFSLSA